jgi:uncharacterized protein (DUF2225 family)
MIVWYTKEMTCPMCGTRLCGRDVGGGFAVGQDSDLLVRMKSRHVIQAEIHTCQTCRFSGYVKDFAINSTPELGRRFQQEITPRLIGGPKSPTSATPLPDVQYYWSYLSARYLKRPPLKLGLLLLRAYWCLRLPPSNRLSEHELNRRKDRYLRACRQYLRQALRGSRNPTLYYLLGEICRRAGEFDAAIDYFDRFLSKDSPANYLKLAASKLKNSALERDASDKTMEEILYDHKKAP